MYFSSLYIRLVKRLIATLILSHTYIWQLWSTLILPFQSNKSSSPTSRFHVSPFLLLFSSGCPSAFLSTHRTLYLLSLVDVALPLASFALHDRKLVFYDNTKIQLLSSSYKFPGLIVLSKKHVCNENNVLCSPSVLLSSHFNNTILERKTKTWSDNKKKKGCREAIGRVREKKEAS